MIRVWALDLSGITEASLLPVRRALSAERRELADRFRFEKDRIRCITAEGLLRFLLCTEYGMKPDEIILDRDENGKPFLKKPERSHLFFNLSHAGDWVVCALGDSNVGVDVEQVPEADPALAKAVMTPGELTAWSNTDKHLQASVFCRLWTLKESYSKYLGIGLSLPFTDVEMKNAEGEEDQMVPSDNDGCRLRSQMIRDDYFLSLCVETENSVELNRDILFQDRDAFLRFFRPTRFI